MRALKLLKSSEEHMKMNIFLIAVIIPSLNCENTNNVQGIPPFNPPELSELVGYWRTIEKKIDFLKDDGSLETTRTYLIDGEEYHIFTDSTYSQMGYFEEYSCRIPQLFKIHFSISKDTLFIPDIDSIDRKIEEQNGNKGNDLRLINLTGKILIENHYVKITSDTAIELNSIYKFKYEKVPLIDTTDWPTKMCD